MKNHNYEYVSTVAREGSFSRAAQKLFISQPALSAAIKKLEAELYGISLFNRGVNPITLTPAGEFYLESAGRIAAIEEEIEQHFASLAGIRSGTLNLGSSSYFCTYVLPGILQRYTIQNPKCTINLIEGSISDMEEKLKSGVLDLTMDVETLDPQMFDAISMGQEHILLAVPSHLEISGKLRKFLISREQILDGSFLSEEIPAIDLSLLADQPFLLLKKQHDMHRRAMAMCRHAGFEPQVRLYLDQLLTAYNIARIGQGITFFRDTLLKYTEPTDKLCYYKLGDELAVRNIWITCKKYPEPSPLAEDFLKYMMMTKI